MEILHVVIVKRLLEFLASDSFFMYVVSYDILCQVKVIRLTFLTVKRFEMISQKI